MKTFEVSYGKGPDAPKGHVRAESHEQVSAYLHTIGWPFGSLVIEIPVMDLCELPAQLARLKQEDLCSQR